MRNLPIFRGSVATAVAAICLALVAPAPAASEPAILRIQGNAAPAATPDAARRSAESAADSVRQRWHEYSLDALAIGSWRWLVSIPPGVHPFEDDGTNCGINQQGRFWYLGAPIDAQRTCVVPTGRVIVAPVFVAVNDYPCPDPNFKPAPGQSLEAFLRDGIAPVIDGVSSTHALLDGKPVRVRRITTGVFPFTGAAGLGFFDSCITGSPQVALADGYFALIEPLRPGDHLLVLRSTSPFGATEARYTLKVRRQHDE